MKCNFLNPSKGMTRSSASSWSPVPRLPARLTNLSPWKSSLSSLEDCGLVSPISFSLISQTRSRSAQPSQHAWIRPGNQFFEGNIIFNYFFPIADFLRTFLYIIIKLCFTLTKNTSKISSNDAKHLLSS